MKPSKPSKLLVAIREAAAVLPLGGWRFCTVCGDIANVEIPPGGSPDFAGLVKRLRRFYEQHAHREKAS